MFVNVEQNMERDASIYVFHADSKGLIFDRHSTMLGSIFLGCIWKKNAWCWVALRTSGSTSLACSVGSWAVSTSGIRPQADHHLGIRPSESSKEHPT
jgi:hypothetical protein